jgi:hypothetical protein
MSRETIAQYTSTSAPEVLSKLKAERNGELEPTLEQLCIVRDGLFSIKSLKDIASEASLEERQVLDLITSVGQWATQARSFGGAEVTWDDDFAESNHSQIPLFRLPSGQVVNGMTKAAGSATRENTREIREMIERKTDEVAALEIHVQQWLDKAQDSLERAERARSDKSLAEHRKAHLDRLEKAKKAQARLDRARKSLDSLLKRRADMGVILHSSFRDAVAIKDVRKSAVMIMVAHPQDHDLARYLQRTRKTGMLLSYEHVTLVWMFAKMGKIDEMPMINPKSRGLSKCLYEAYELLETGRSDAMRSLLVLSDTESTQEEMRQAAVMARTVFPGLAGRFISALDTGIDKLVDRERAYLLRHLEVSCDSLLVKSIAHLSEDQVLRICRAAGLHTDGSSRVEESSIRNRLMQLGLVNDTGKLLPLGVKAERLGLKEEFWQAVDRWRDGDLDWDAELLPLMQ